MFKKLSSNIDPEATVLKEFRKEFATYFDKVEEGRNQLLHSYPKEIYTGMLIALIISCIVCFFIYTPSERQKDKMPDMYKKTANVTDRVTGGIGEIVDLTSKISDLNILKKKVEAVLMKPSLTHADTIFLESAIQQLEKRKTQTKETDR